MNTKFPIEINSRCLDKQKQTAKQVASKGNLRETRTRGLPKNTKQTRSSIGRKTRILDRERGRFPGTF